MSNQVTLEELEDARNAGELIVDVRGTEEYSAGHIAGARLMPLDDVAGRLHELPRDRPVYVVCQKGGRSAEAARLMVESGVDARFLAGGTEAWIASGRRVETGA